MSDQAIKLRGVSVHNLQGIDLDLPHGKLIVVCGVSGSGKTSLALDTLYAEGQRRYIESFSAYTRQFLERLERPDADSITGLPPAIAVTRAAAQRSSRATVATATEISDFLQLLFARVGRVFCQGCHRELIRESPASIAASLQRLPESTRLMVGFFRAVPAETNPSDILDELRSQGFVRLLSGEATLDLATSKQEIPLTQFGAQNEHGFFVIVDRLAISSAIENRFIESLEAAQAQGNGTCFAWIAAEPETLVSAALPAGQAMVCDARPGRFVSFSDSFTCDACRRVYPHPEPRCFNFNSPLGACAQCEGFGNVLELDLELITPDTSKSIREGAIAPWNTPSHAKELTALLQLAEGNNLPVDIPFAQLTPEQKSFVFDGNEAAGFSGVRSFFANLERQTFKMPVRAFLSRFRSDSLCTTCQGTRLRSESLAVQLGGLHFAQCCALRVTEAIRFFNELDLPSHHRAVADKILEQVAARLRFLEVAGLGYLTLDRTFRTLSSGEAQRVALTSALGSTLVNMLYVLDEPSVGLHACDVDRLLQAIESLRDRGNTVVVVEHEESIIRAANQVVEIGPGAGDRGGKIVCQCPPNEVQNVPGSITGDFLGGRRGVATPERRRPPDHGWIRLAGARGNNLQNVTVEFPLGVLCVVAGVSGSGKSTLIQDTLYGAICRRKRIDTEKPYPYLDLYGEGQIDNVVLVDQSPIGRSPRSNPVTFIKAFDEIRAVFADTLEARTHHFTAGHFSFNVDGGRCSACEGDGYIAVDMQFLADVYMKCSQCQGRRYRKEILAITYRGKSIADVLDMTVREAFAFFRGQAKVQLKLKRLLDVGLEYLRLGQGANTLSTGEAQRLKLAAYLTTAARNRTLFLLDEPTTGLHFADVVQLLDCFDALLAVGHSLIVVEHNLQIMRAADYIIELGPGAADQGGRVVATGTPESVARRAAGPTGKILARMLQTKGK